MQFKKFFSELYRHLVRINDSNQKIALGMGLGIFLGIFPGAGPVASLVLAAAFRVNKAAALLGCLLTNTWLSFATAILAIKIGAMLFHLQWQKLLEDTRGIITNFSFSGFFNLTVLKILAPVLAGYLITAFVLGLLAYLATFFTLKKFRSRHT